MPPLPRVGDTEILLIAREMFLAHGPGVSFARIAQRLGISKAALVERMGSKARLLERSLYGEVRLGLEAVLGPDPDVDDLRSSLIRSLEDALQSCQEALPEMIVRKQAGLELGLPAQDDDEEDEAHPPPPFPVRLRRALTRRLVHVGIGDPYAEAIAEVVLGSIEARCLHRYLGLPVSPPEDWEFLVLLVDDIVQIRLVTQQ